MGIMKCPTSGPPKSDCGGLC